MQLILIELNELNFKYAKEYFEKLSINSIKEISEKLIVTKSEEKYELLEPWIQWHSIHTGFSAEDHGIFRLGDVIHSSKKQIFEELEEKKLKIGSISAMNSSNNLKNPSYFIPDPWTDTKSDSSFFSKIITQVFSMYILKIFYLWICATCAYRIHLYTQNSYYQRCKNEQTRFLATLPVPKCQHSKPQKNCAELTKKT